MDFFNDVMTIIAIILIGIIVLILIIILCLAMCGICCELYEQCNTSRSNNENNIEIV